MKRLALIGLALAVRVVTATASTGAGTPGSEEWTSVEVVKGTVSFEAATSLPAMSVRGTSNQLVARARMRRGLEGVTLEEIEATLPVRSLVTGIGVRDEHMRTRVFATADGRLPDLRFLARESVCSLNDAGRQTICRLSGELTIRDTPRPFVISMSIASDGDRFRAQGGGVVKLSEYGIAQPSQLGVTTTDEVKFHLAFVARVIDREAVARVPASQQTLHGQ
jgi:polyisoprenoid-binding protein YceI